MFFFGGGVFFNIQFLLTFFQYILFNFYEIFFFSTKDEFFVSCNKKKKTQKGMHKPEKQNLLT